jgi:hypothetical protein
MANRTQWGIIWFTDQEMGDFAAEASRTLTWRRWEWGGTVDEQRESTEDEARLLQTAMKMALTTIRAGYDVHAAINTAEVLVQMEGPKEDSINAPSGDDNHINTYDSVYKPLQMFLQGHSER